MANNENAEASHGGQDNAPPRSYKLIVDHQQHDWPKSLITGLEIKRLAGVDAAYGVWQDVPGPNDPPVGDIQEVDLSGPGLERFFTGKKTTTEG